MTEDAFRTYMPAALAENVAAVFAGAGAPENVASLVAGLLVKSEQIGHPSHGVLRVQEYLRRIDEGRLVPDATGSIVRETATSTLIDGGCGFGQVTAALATERAIERATETGVAAAGAYHINHVGRLGDYTEMAASAGLIAFAFVGGTPTGMRGNVAPFGGREAVWGTNPMAIAIPGEDRMFSLDFATSVIAAGKAMAARARETLLDDDHLLDRDGRPSRDPEVLFDGGSIRPFGGHKGYGLAFAVELLAGALIGALAPELGAGEMHNGMLLLALDPKSFGSADAFRRSVGSVIDRVKACPPAEGFEEVLYPGEPEQRAGVRSDTEGVRIPVTVVEVLGGLSDRLGVDVRW